MTLGSVSRERWRVLEPLLDAALELDPAERLAFLDDTCGRDRRLRAEVEALLLACERAHSILAEPAAIAYEPLIEPLLARDPPTLPRLLGGRYHIVREIARGGMATVHLANDPKHGRQVAVKVLHAEVARVIGCERFMREIEIAASLSHPHILPLYDSGEVPSAEAGEPPCLYFVSPFVTGESLRDRLQREPRLTPDEGLRLGREIAQALDYAHRQGVVHLDVKPENILLQDGHAVIADFGIAHAMSSATERASGEATLRLGTPGYMSPEQAVGAPHLDGRSDIYSLGCVLYEMVAGKRPFGRGTPAEAIERARVPTPPDRSFLVKRVSRETAAVIMRAMSPASDKRFQTAGELAAALTETARARKRRGWRRRGAMAGCALALGASLAALWAGRDPPLDPNLIAVAPFDAEASSLALWREGLVDVMSRNFDGAGALRAVPATVVVRRWSGRADAQSARALGERTGARLVLFGGLLAAGDSVRATAVLLDAKSGNTLAEFEQRDTLGRLDRLSDSLTMAVLREIGRSRRIGVTRATSSPTASLPALKAYLQGEHFYRAALWDSAQARFEHALTLDSTFALAYHRLAAVRRWLDPKEIPDSTTYALMRRTSQFTRGLGPRERLLATVDSLSAEAYFAWIRGLRDARRYRELQPVAEQLYAVLGDGLLRYPNDAELWMLLADVRSRWDSDVAEGEVDDRAILSLYDHAIALDSAFAPAYVVPITLAAYLDGAARARSYIRAYLALEPSGAHSKFIRLADLVLDPARASKLDIAALVDTLPSHALCEVSTLLRHIPDSAETLVRIAHALADRRPDSAGRTSGPTCAHWQAIEGLQFRGHLADALRLRALQSHGDRTVVLYNMWRFGMVPEEAARVELASVLSRSPHTTMTKMYGWWAALGDTSAIQTYITHLEAGGPRLAVPAAASRARAKLAAGRAFLALATHDTASALNRLLTTPDTLDECWHDNRVVTVQLLIAKQRYREAATRLERRWPGTSECSNGVDDVVWTLARARVFDRLGRAQQAAADYAFIADAWRTADPELQPYVRESRAAIARLRRR